MRFKNDFLSIFGSTIFTSIHRYFTYFKVFKCVRVFRIGSLITRSNESENVKAVMKLGKLIFYLVMYLHVVACFFNTILSYNSAQVYFQNHDGYF